MTAVQADAYSMRIGALEQQFQGMNITIANIANRQQDQDAAISNIHSMVDDHSHDLMNLNIHTNATHALSPTLMFNGWINKSRPAQEQHVVAMSQAPSVSLSAISLPSSAFGNAPIDAMSMGPSTPRSQSCSASFRS